MSTQPTKDLAVFFAGMTRESLPPTIRDQVTDIILDTVVSCVKIIGVGGIFSGKRINLFRLGNDSKALPLSPDLLVRNSEAIRNLFVGVTVLLRLQHH